MISVEDYVNLPVVAPEATFAYGQEPNQMVELYLPLGDGLHPVVVFVHGGCWGERYGAKPLGGLCRALTEVGFAVWNIDYRRNGNGGGYPQTFLDVAQAADLLRTVAAEHALDLSRLVTMGHSVGGHLALWLAARNRVLPTSAVYSANPLSVRGVVCLAGIIDTVGAVAQGLCGENLPRIMGGLPQDVPERYQSTSPMELLPLGVRQIHVVGAADEEILVNVRPYIDAARNAGDHPELMIVPEAGHFELVVATTEAWPVVCEAAVKLLS